MDRVERNAPWRADDGNGNERYLAGQGDSSWSPWVEATFFHVHFSTHEQVLDRMRSVSHIAALAPDDQRQVLDEITIILTNHHATRHHETVGIPYRVDTMYTERLG